MIDSLKYLSLFKESEMLSLGALRSGNLFSLGLRKVLGKIIQPINSPFRYPEYITFFNIIRRLMHTAGNVEIKSVLDIGSPKMFSLLLAARWPFNIVLTDLYAPAIKEAEVLAASLPEKIRRRLSFFCCDCREKIVLPDSSADTVDLIYAMSVIEHIHPPIGGDLIALSSLAGQLRPGGYMILSLPVSSSGEVQYSDKASYGNMPVGAGLYFQQRIYDSTMLKSLVSSLAPTLKLLEVHVLTWPQNIWLKIFFDQPFSENLLALLGPFFPLIAKSVKVDAPVNMIPDNCHRGDIVLTLKKV